MPVSRKFLIAGFAMFLSALSAFHPAFSAAPAGAEASVMDAHGGPVARMAPTGSPPQIDGKISEGEWDDALVLAGTARHTRGGPLEQRRAQMYLMFDSDNLYVAVRTETAPGNQLRFWPQPPEEYVGSVDGVELWIAPLPKPEETPVDVFQLWWNPGEAFYGEVTRHGVGFNFRGEGVEFKNRIEDDRWTLEASVPWADLGVDGNEMVRTGTHFLVRPTRNWKNPFIYGSWGGPGAFALPGEMIRVVVDHAAPVVQIPELGRILEGEPDLGVNLRLPAGGPESYNVSVTVLKGEDAVVETRKELSLSEGQSGSVVLDQPFEVESNQRLKLDITRISDGGIILRRHVSLAPARSLGWQPVEPEGVSVRGGYYPYHSKARAIVNLADLEEAPDVTRAHVEVRAAGGDSVLGAGDVTEFIYNRGDVVIELPELRDGEYEMAARLYTGDDELKMDEPVTRRFERYTQSWEHNRIGITDRVYPPFEPLEVSGGFLSRHTVSCVLRSHDIDGLGFWTQVRSMDRPLLAGPIHLQLTSGGEKLPWRIPRRARFVQRDEHRVVHKGRAESEKIAVETKSIWDYDGGVRYEITLEPRGDGRVDELALAIPLKEEEASLFHAHSMIRSNPQGYIPGGEGVVWDSSEVVRFYGELGTMIPYIWVGGPERGIAWWAANDSGWITDDDEAAIQIVRSEGTVSLRVRLINRPVTLQAPREIVFGLMATPAKPQPEGWRGWGREPRPWVYSLASWYFAGLSDTESLMPIGNDWEGARLLARMRDEGRYDHEAVMEWLAEHGLEECSRATDMTPHLFRGMARKGHEIILYANPPLESGRTPQGRTFGWEWRGGRGGISARKTASYIDYAVYSFDKMLESSLDGIYHDNTWPMANRDNVSGEGYRREDGRMEVGWDIWGQREFYRRLYVAAWERTGRYPLIWVHDTNAHIVPYFSFVTMGYGPEWCARKGPGTSYPFQKAFPFDLLRAGTTGKQAGLMKLTLSHYGRAESDKRAFLNRTLTGTSLVHDMRSRQRPHDRLIDRMNELVDYFDPELEVFPYWSNEGLVSSDGGIRVTLYKHGQRLIAAACSIAEEKGVNTHEISLNLKELQLPEDLKIKDVEEKGGVEVTGPGSVRFELQQYDFRLIYFAAE